MAKPDETPKTPTPEQLRAAREKALTAEQIKRREEVARHTAIISAGVKPPSSGTFGKTGGPPTKGKR